jgi:hypothetical protein
MQVVETVILKFVLNDPKYWNTICINVLTCIS